MFGLRKDVAGSGGREGVAMGCIGAGLYPSIFTFAACLKDAIIGSFVRTKFGQK
jgi:hypothetical protein